MHNTKHIWRTTILVEQYLWEQIGKALQWLEDVFMEAVPAEADRQPKLWPCNCRAETAQDEIQVNEEGEDKDNTPLIRKDLMTHDRYKRSSAPPTKQVSKTSSAYDKQPGCTAVADEPSTVSGSTKSLRHIIRIRSGWIAYRALRLMINA